MKIVPGPLGKYVLLERLGVGGMAEVWKASDARLQRYVAVKFLHATLLSDPTFLARFVREAQAVASMHHPNIVQIYDFETPDPSVKDSPAYMVMDYIEGLTLAEYLQDPSRRFLAPLELVSLFFSISEAMDYAHQRGLLHRDIKPGNILLDRRHTERNAMGEPVLSDFGIVKMLGSATGALTSASIGTPLYISPEQAQGRSDSAASDIYSLSVILYQVCTGELPFQADNPFAVMQQHISKPPEPPEKINPAISPALSAVILRGLAKKPEERFPSAGAMVAAMADALNVALPAKRRGPISSPDWRTQEPPTSPKEPVEVVDTGALTIVEQSTEAEKTVLQAKPFDPAAAASLSQSDIQALPTLIDTSPRGLSKMESDAPVRLPDPIITSPHSLRRPPASRRRRGILVALLLLVVVLAGSGLATFLVLQGRASSSSSQILGSAFFTSSGSGDGASNRGLNDTFQVNLTSISAPASGKQYYAWLLPDVSQSEANPRSLGPLTLRNGAANLPTPYVDPQHASLIAQFSRFLVTEESSSPLPSSPSLDTGMWRYYAQIPQSSPVVNCQGTVTQLSVLCHLRHLLSNDPDLMQVHLQGGLNYWFLTNLKEVQKWVQEAVDSHNGDDIRHKAVNILTTIDGLRCVQQDLLQGAKGESNVPDDPNLSKTAAIALLDCSLTPDFPGYLSHIHNHLNAILQSPGVTGSQKTLGVQIGSELNMLNEWLTEIRTDALQLIAMNDEHLLQTNGRNMVNQMNALTTNVLSGGTDPKTGQFQKGAISISAQIQQMATMDVRTYTHN